MAKDALLGLECFVVLFVGLHNWIPLGKLNDVKGVRAEFPGRKLVVTTLVNFTPFAFGLAATVYYFSRPFPGWLFWWLWISYGLAVYGSLPAWWIPYLFRRDQGAGGALSGDARIDACLSAEAQRHSTEYVTCDL
jgi:hypothetical protein